MAGNDQSDSHDVEETPRQAPQPDVARSRRKVAIAGGAVVAAAVAGGGGYLLSRELSALQITVNGAAHPVKSSPDTPLLYVLRDELLLTGPRFGCGLGECGTCTVHLAGEAVRSCQVKIGSVGSKAVVTLEGLGSLAHPHPVQQAFIEAQAAQCGYCMNGWIMTAAAFLAKNSRPTTAEIKSALGSLICRCGTHTRILQAVEKAAGIAAS